MTDRSSGSPEPKWAAFLAIDWADKKHAWSLYVPDASKREHGEIAHSPEAIHVWISQLTARFAGRPIAVCVEQSRGALLFTLSKYGNLVLYPIHPATANDFRKAVYPSGTKSDPVDADVLLDFCSLIATAYGFGNPILSRLVRCNSWWKIAVAW